MNRTFPFRPATIFATMLVLAVVLFAYVLCAPLDIVFMKDGEEVYRQENVSVLSSYDDPFDYIEADEEEIESGLAFFYGDRGGNFQYDASSMKFRFRVAKTTLKCLITFKLSEEDRVIVCKSYYVDN